ncbi:MAG: hypothetical protein V8S22_05240 [Lachnospiraceae bacterium]
MPKYAALLELEEIRDAYRRKLRQELLDFYDQDPRKKTAFMSFFMRSI